MVNLGATAAAVVAMVVGSSVVDGDGRVVVLGLAHALGVTLGSVVLFGRVRARLGRPVVVGPSLVRSAIGAGLCGLTAWAVVETLDAGSRGAALVSLVAAGVVGLGVYLGVQRVTGGTA